MDLWNDGQRSIYRTNLQSRWGQKRERKVEKDDMYQTAENLLFGSIINGI